MHFYTFFESNVRSSAVETSFKAKYPMNLISYITKNTQLPVKGIENTVALLNEDCTLPFISRYRKERTGNLDEVQIGAIVQFKAQFEALEKRKSTILKAIEEQDSLTPELGQKIANAEDLTTLEDLYLPFKKKRKTKAETAIKNGLEPLAKIILAQRTDEIDFEASKYVSDTVPNEDDALEGARHIISEWINERSRYSKSDKDPIGKIRFNFHQGYFHQER